MDVNQLIQIFSKVKHSSEVNKKCVEFAIACAERHIRKYKYSDDIKKIEEEVLQASKNWLKNPTEENTTSLWEMKESEIIYKSRIAVHVINIIIEHESNTILNVSKLLEYVYVLYDDEEDINKEIDWERRTLKQILKS